MLRRHLASSSLIAFLVILATAFAAFTGLPDPAADVHGQQAAQDSWTTLFNGRDFAGWDTYLAPPNDSNGRRLSDQPIGLNKDPHHVFTVVNGTIRISGEDVGAVTTKSEYGDYHLQLLFRWGTKTWGQKKGKKKDSGLLYHSVGPYGADWGAWMRSQEFQVQEGDCGDYWGCAGGTADVPADKKSDSEYIYNPAAKLTSFRVDNAIGRHCIKSSDAEKPSGEWNTLDLYCHGDTSVHVVNGKLVMILYHNGQVDNGLVRPLTRGRIQLQSEGAEVYYKDIRIRPIDNLPQSLISADTARPQTPPIQHITARIDLNLDGRWNYIIDPYENGFYDYRHDPYDQSPSGKGGFYDDKKQTDKSELIEYDFDHSPTLKVPGDWNSQDDKLLYYEGTIWYRRVFSLAPQPGRRYFLYFGAVNYEAHIYLNGKKLGKHKGGFTPFQFEVTGLLKEGDNSLVVKADNSRKKDEIPTINTDWWNYGGITRDVVLASAPETFVSDYKVQLAKNDPNRIVGYVQLDGTIKKDITISIPEAGVLKTLSPDASGHASFDIPIKKLDYWSPEHPRLYAVTIKTGNDEVSDQIGFRTIQVKGKDILLNGKPVFLRGISIHDENPLIPGRNRSEGDLRMLLTWAKQLNCNYVRLAHYPHNETMLRLADEMGLMVWAEVPVYWTISWENPDTYRNASQQLTDLITRDKNRASVIIWSIGNETPLSQPRLDFMSRLAARAHSLDSTRLVSAALEVHRQGSDVIVDDPLGEKLDLVSFNEYAGWYWGDKLTDLPNYHFRIKYDRPVIITEFGGDALQGFHADSATRWSEEYQELLYKNQLRMLSGIDALRGMTPWILTDFRSPRRQHPIYQNFWNRKGLISESGQKKKAFYVLQSFYDQLEKKYR